MCIYHYDDYDFNYDIDCYNNCYNCDYNDDRYSNDDKTYKHPRGTTILVASNRDDGQTLKLNRAPMR